MAIERHTDSVSANINRNALKYIAIVAMVSDHIAAALIPKETPPYFIMRLIGRLTAPIMCYFITEGFYHTRSRRNYGLRL